MFSSRAVLAVGLVFLSAAAGFGQTFGGVKIVESGVAYSGVGTFTAFSVRPSISGSLTSFGGNPTGGPPNATLVAMSTGGAPTLIANTTTAVPGGSSNFAQFNVSPLGLSGSVYAFLGSGNPPNSPGNFGAFSNVTGALAPVVNNAAGGYPGGGAFVGIGTPAVSGTTIALVGTNSGFSPAPLGVFTRTGAGPLVTVANTSTAMPGGGTFASFTDPGAGPTSPNIAGPNVVFNGQNAAATSFGLYLAPAAGGGPATAVATNTTAIPNGTGTFTSFGSTIATSGTNIAFFGLGTGGQQGFYRVVGGVVSRVADRTTAVPGGGSFNTLVFTDVAISGDRVAFRGTSTTGVTGIYTDLGGVLAKVVATGDILDGKTVNGVAMGQYGFQGDTVAALVSFSNGTSGVYRFAPVPEPAGVLAVGLAGLAAARLRRRRAGFVS